MAKDDVSNKFFNSINLGIRDVLILNGFKVISVVIYAIIYLLIRKTLGWRVGQYNDIILYICDGIIIFIISKYKLRDSKFLGLNQLYLKRNIKFTFALVFFIYFTKFCILLILGKDFLLSNEKYISFFVSDSIWIFLLHSIIAIAIAPIIEEIIYRGFFYSPLRRRFGIFPGIIISSLIFTIWHFGVDIKGIINIFLVGVLLAYIYEKTMSLLPCIIAHGIINLSWIMPISYKLLESKGITIFKPVQFLSLLAVVYLGLSLLFYFSYKKDKLVNT